MILDLSGRLWILDSALREKISELLQACHRYFLVNLASVSYIDSSGLGQLVSIWTSVKNRGGHLLLLQPNERVAELFKITKLNTVFEILADERQALARLRSSLAASA